MCIFQFTGMDPLANGSITNAKLPRSFRNADVLGVHTEDNGNLLPMVSTEQWDKKQRSDPLSLRGSGVEGMMKGTGIAILLMLIATGCATPYARQWERQLWQAQEKSTQTPEIGRLETETLDFDILVTKFRERRDQAQSFIGVSISSRNQTQDTILLEEDPIQVVDATNVLVKALPLDHVMYQLYGGNLRESAQQARLRELSQPIPSGTDNLSIALSAIVEAFRATERTGIITEMHIKEALPYDLYYQSFTPTSLPPGVATVWTEYYPSTTDKITVMRQGQRVEDGITFGPPPPPPPPTPEQVRQARLGTFITRAILSTFLVVVFLVSSRGK